MGLREKIARGKVRKGIVLLHKRRPGWVGEIDLSAFEIEDPRRCILGQLYSIYGIGCIKLELTRRDERAYGFLEAKWSPNWLLNKLWKEEIILRRQDAVLHPG